MTIAHAGHWYHALLYLLPVLVISVALWWSGDDGEDEEDDDLLGPPELGDGDQPGPVR